MKQDSLILERLKSLRWDGEYMLREVRPKRKTDAVPTSVDVGKAAEWATKCRSLVGRVFGETSEHYLGFNRALAHSESFIPCIERALGVLRAAISDYEDGYLFRVRDLVHADVIGDLTSQARALLDAGYHPAAAVVAGCILEDALRTLCDKHKDRVVLPDRPKLDLMNGQLAAAGVYSKLVQKRITALADIRNSAAHGHWDKLVVADVEDMLQYVERFVADYLGA